MLLVLWHQVPSCHPQLTLASFCRARLWLQYSSKRTCPGNVANGASKVSRLHHINLSHSIGSKTAPDALWQAFGGVLRRHMAHGEHAIQADAVYPATADALHETVQSFLPGRALLMQERQAGTEYCCTVLDRVC